MHSKLPETQGSFFWEMKKLAIEHNAIDMSVGMVEFSCPTRLAELAAGYIHENYNNYAPFNGILPLRERISETVFKNYGKKYDPLTEITICAGPSQAATIAINTIVSEGDEVIVPDPSYFTYSQAIRLNGGTPVHVPLKEPSFRIDWEDVRKMISSKTRMIILNTPHNPTGTVFGKDDLFQLQRLTNGTGIYILSDEGFEHLVYDQEKHQSVAQYANLAARSFIISSAGPVFHINGWNLAWCCAPQNMMQEFRKVNECYGFSVSTPLQHALADYWEHAGEKENITELYQGKRNYFNRLLKGSAFTLEPSQGSYFQLVNFKKISNEPDTEFAHRLVKEAGVSAMPLSLFMHKKRNLNYLRFCFAKKNETLDEVAKRLLRFADNNSLPKA
jgi:methionine transaminase